MCAFFVLFFQVAFEKKLHAKTRNPGSRMEAEIVIIDGNTCVYKGGTDVVFYVVGGGKENELILVAVLDALFDALSLLLRDEMEKRRLLDNLDLLMLGVDELVDGGVILEVDHRAIASRVLMKGSDSDTPLNELTISQALATAKDQIAKSFQRN